jgi:hypothetical protein
MNYYFIAALVVSIMNTVRAELKRTTFSSKSIRALWMTQSSMQGVLEYFFRGFKQLVHEVFRLRLVCVGVRKHRAAPLFPLS